MTLTIALRRPTLRIDKGKARLLSETLRSLAAASAKCSGAPDYESVSVVLTGDSLISRIHEEAMDVGGTTDVITLSYAATPESPASAEIFVNARMAARCGDDRSSLDLIEGESNRPWSPEHELALYIAHGFDHLAGHDDDTASGFRSMRRREIKWVCHAHALGLLDGLLVNREVVND